MPGWYLHANGCITGVSLVSVLERSPAWQHERTMPPLDPAHAGIPNNGNAPTSTPLMLQGMAALTQLHAWLHTQNCMYITSTRCVPWSMMPPAPASSSRLARLST